MELILTSEEGQFLAKLLEERYRELLRELTHTDHRDFKLMLKQKAQLLEAILEKLGVFEAVHC